MEKRYAEEARFKKECENNEMRLTIERAKVQNLRTEVYNRGIDISVIKEKTKKLRQLKEAKDEKIKIALDSLQKSKNNKMPTICKCINRCT